MKAGLSKSILMWVAEAILPTSLLTRVRFTLYGKWGDKLDGVESISETSQGRTAIPGLLRALWIRSPRMEQCLVHAMEDSVFDRPDADAIPRYMAGGRPRLATCTGVSWFEDRHIAVANFHGRHARIYSVEGDLESGRDLHLQLRHHQDHPFAPPEDVAVSPDRRLMAVTHAPPGDHMTTIHQLDAETLKPGPVKQRLGRGTATHGVTFSPDSRFLFFTEIFTGAVQVYDVTRLPAKRTQSFVVPIAPRVPKSVAVSADCQFVAVAHSAEVSLGREHLTGARIAVYRFNAETGRIEDEPIAYREGITNGLVGIESCSFLRGADGGPYLLATCDQCSDLVRLFRFEPDESRLETVCTLDGVSFPHGVDANPTSTLMAVACYGDDTLRLFKLPTDEQLSKQDDRPHVLLCDGGRGDGNSRATAINIETIAQLLSSQRYRVTCLVAADNADKSLSWCCDRIVRLDFPEASPGCPFNEQNAARLETLIREEAVDIVQVQGITYMAALEAARRVGIPALVYLSDNECELLAANGNSPAQALLQSLCSLADFQITDSTAAVVEQCDTTLPVPAKKQAATQLVALYEKVLAVKVSPANSHHEVEGGRTTNLGHDE